MSVGSVLVHSQLATEKLEVSEDEDEAIQLSQIRPGYSLEGGYIKFRPSHSKVPSSSFG